MTRTDLAGEPGLAEESGLESQTGAFGIMTDAFRRGEVVLLTGAGLSTESGIPDCDLGDP